MRRAWNGEAQHYRAPTGAWLLGTEADDRTVPRLSCQGTPHDSGLVAMQPPLLELWGEQHPQRHEQKAFEEVILLLVTQHLDRRLSHYGEVQRWSLGSGIGKEELMRNRRWS